jgi:thioredoxin 1
VGSGIIKFQIVILPVLMSDPKPLAPVDREFLVVCLCAAWCGTCREYETGFKELGAQYPEVGFIWVDIEDENSGVEDWDIENFPTLLIQRNELVLFFGPMLPHSGILKQALDTYLAQGQEEARAYAHATLERAAWQVTYDFRGLNKEGPYALE